LVAIGTPVLLIIAILVGIFFSRTLLPITAQPLGISGSQPTPIHHYGPEAGNISDSLISPDNVTFQIVDIQRDATKWLFHIHAHNNADLDTKILDAGTSHYFMLGLQGPAGTPIPPDQGEVILAAPAQPDAAAHPALPAVVASNADVDGWLVADLTNAKYKPFQLFYVYGTVPTVACANPRDTSTCHTETAWRTLVWML
jgi:hypothetical protein